MNNAENRDPAIPAHRREGNLPVPRARVVTEQGGRQVGPAAPSSGGVPNALELLKALRYRWALALILGLLCGGLAAGATYAVLGAPEYSAYALLEVKEQQPRIIFKTDETQASFATYQKTQLTQLKSRLVLNAAIRDDEQVAALKLDQRHPDPVAWLEKEIQASYLGELLKISMNGPEPSELADLVNAVADAYIKEVVKKDEGERLDHHEELKTIYTEYQDRLEAKRKELKTLAEQLGSSDRETIQFAQELAIERRELAKQELMDIGRELQRLRIELAVRRETLARTGVASTGLTGAPSDAMVAQDVGLQQYDGQIAELRDRLQQRQRLIRKPSDPAIQSAQQAISRLEAGRAEYLSRLRAQLGQRPLGGVGSGPGELIAMEEKIRVLEELQHLIGTDVASMDDESRQISRDTWLLDQVRDELAQIDAAAKKIGGEVEALNVELEARPRVRWFERAQDPRLQDDKRPTMAGVAGFGAFGLALLGVSFLEYRARRIHSVEAIVGDLQLRLVGSLPALPSRRGRAAFAGGESDARWRSIMLESVDAMRTLLLRSSSADAIRSVMITSAVAGEGKTSLASHLSTSLARAGRRTLLVDCDLRKPDVHRLFDVVEGPGLSELLRGEVDLEAAIHPSPAADLWILPAGASDERAVQALSQPGAAAIFDRLRSEFDFVVVDTAPVLPVADSLLVGQYVDGAIYSVLRGTSRIPKVIAAGERLRSVGVRILGAVMTGVQGDAYGSQYAYSYAYPGPARADSHDEE